MFFFQYTLIYIWFFFVPWGLQKTNVPTMGLESVFSWEVKIAKSLRGSIIYIFNQLFYGIPCIFLFICVPRVTLNKCYKVNQIVFGILAFEKRHFRLNNLILTYHLNKNCVHGCALVFRAKKCHLSDVNILKTIWFMCRVSSIKLFQKSSRNANKWKYTGCPIINFVVNIDALDWTFRAFYLNKKKLSSLITGLVLFECIKPHGT